MAQSTLAGLASRATPASAIAGNAPAPKKNFTGQYLLSRFVTDKDEKTKLAIIGQMVEALDAKQLESNLADMMTSAKQLDITNGVEEKAVITTGPTYRAASNTRGIIQKIYGALKFAPDELVATGYVDSMGYHTVSGLAKKALEIKAITWKGDAGKTKEQRASEKSFKDEAAALKEVQKEHTRKDGESFVEYQRRCLPLVSAKLTAMRESKEQETIDVEVQRILDMGNDKAQAIAEFILIAVNAVATV